MSLVTGDEKRNKNIERIGRFKLSSTLIRTLEYDALIEIMKNFIIIKCEHDYYSNTFEYTALSHLFDIIEEGLRIPEYVIQIKNEEDGSRVTVIKK